MARRGVDKGCERDRSLRTEVDGFTLDRQHAELVESVVGREVVVAADEDGGDRQNDREGPGWPGGSSRHHLHNTAGPPQRHRDRQMTAAGVAPFGLLMNSGDPGTAR